MSVTLMTETNLYKDGAIAGGLEDASKVATNYLSYNQQDGLSVGRIGQSERAVIASDGMEIYDGLNDQIAQFKAVTRLGLANKANLKLDYHSLQLQDTNGNTYVHMSDLRDNTGYATIEDTFVGDGSTTTFTLVNNIRYASDVQSVKIDNVATTNYTVSTSVSLNSDKVIFTTAPANGAIISITYKTTDSMIAFTFGNRLANSNIGGGSFSNGGNNTASGSYSHAEGIYTKTLARGSHAEGYYSKATGNFSHAEGDMCNANGTYSHAEGNTNTANGNVSHAEGYKTVANGYASHSEGTRGTADGLESHVEGNYCTTNSNGEYAHSEGDHCEANNTASHSEGTYCIASGEYSHAEGHTSTASALCAHAEGRGGTANADYSHVEGRECTVSGAGEGAHAEGYKSYANGKYSHAEGNACEATANYSHAEGTGTKTGTSSQHVSGIYNVHTTTEIFVVGGGNSSTRKNALTLNTSGYMTIAGTLTQQSDKRLKYHRAYLSDQQNEVNEFINRLKPAWFEKDEQKHLGFYAQDVQQTDRWQCMVDNDTNGYLTLGYTEILAPLVAYCQNLKQKVETLEQRIERLEQLLNQQ